MLKNFKQNKYIKSAKDSPEFWYQFNKLESMKAKTFAETT